LCDEQGTRIDSRSSLVKPVGFDIPASATEVHRITTARATREGADLAEVLREFASAIERARVAVAHNIGFDEKIVAAEFLRARIQNRLADVERCCTMKASTDFCAIPNRYGFKWPTLAELHERLFASIPADAHDADADVQVCAKCFFELQRRNIIQVPRA